MKINLTEMMRLRSRLADIKEETKKIFDGINNELDTVSSNIKSNGLHNSISSLEENICNLSKSIETDMETLNGFIEQQIGSYNTTDETASTALNNLIAFIQQNFDADGNILIAATATITATANALASGASAIETYLSGVQGSSVTLPKGLGKSHSYMGWQLITSKSSTQYKLKEAAGMNFDEDGFGKIGDRYVVATTTTFGNVGDYIDVVQDDGTVIKAIIGDIKSQNDRDCNEWGHDYGLTVVEFVVDKTSWYNTEKHVNTFHPEWKQNITEIINKGNYFDLNP